jgi:NADH-quinone oxidoreductase subunit M
MLILVGTFIKSPSFAAVAASGMILGAAYMLWMYQRVFLGKVTNSANLEMRDIGIREKALLVPILLVMLWIGVYSAPFLQRMDASLQLVQQRIHNAHAPAGGYRVDRHSGGAEPKDHHAILSQSQDLIVRLNGIQ